MNHQVHHSFESIDQLVSLGWFTPGAQHWHLILSQIIGFGDLIETELHLNIIFTHTVSNHKIAIAAGLRVIGWNTVGVPSSFANRLRSCWSSTNVNESHATQRRVYREYAMPWFFAFACRWLPVAPTMSQALQHTVCLRSSFVQTNKPKTQWRRRRRTRSHSHTYNTQYTHSENVNEITEE